MPTSYPAIWPFREDSYGHVGITRRSAYCDQHTTVIPSEAYSLLPGDERMRAVARMQQQTAALRAEVLRLRAQQEALAEMAYVDSLTGLSNRRAFDMHLEREWALTLRDGIDSFVVVADLDRFKLLNDTCGHAAGDQVLRQFARALRSRSSRSCSTTCSTRAGWKASWRCSATRHVISSPAAAS